MSHTRSSQLALIIGSLGVVFGDLGTSPLYTLQECFTGTHGIEPTHANIFGILSLIFWSLMVVVTLKYVVFLMRADNQGEGGILALLALAPQRFASPRPGTIGVVAYLAVIGSALLFGDGMITPAISVLSAIEGIKVATPALDSAVVPITVVILIGLFAAQSRGTGGLAPVFGPVMLLWFGSLAVLGGLSIAHHPEILGALSPHHGVAFFQEHGWHGFKVLGGVVLAVTGGEALYADMAHFGRGPINRAWLLVCLPSLVICYFGEGALLLDHPEAVTSPFYSLCPGGVALYPFVVLATLATIIASQALISGVFSLTHQAVQLGFFPRVTVKHTSHEAEGQIYVPLLNWGLMVACCLLVVIFRESSKLAAAFGLAVSGTMAITSILFYVVTRNTWGWSRLRAGAVLVLFLSFDIPFLIANALKFFDGGYVPFVVASVFVVIMATWRIGRGLLADRFARTSTDLDAFLVTLGPLTSQRIPGTGVFLASLSKGVPPVLTLLWERLGVVHERALLVTVVTEHEPVVPEERRSEVVPIGQGFYRVIVRYGFTEQADIPRIIGAVLAGLDCQDGRVVYVLGKETFIATSEGKMGATLESIFAFLSRNARNATDYFRIPPDQVLELGSHIDL